MSKRYMAKFQRDIYLLIEDQSEIHKINIDLTQVAKYITRLNCEDDVIEFADLVLGGVEVRPSYNIAKSIIVPYEEHPLYNFGEVTEGSSELY